MQEFEFYSPKTLDELVCILEETGGEVIAGGTDILPRVRRGRMIANHVLVNINGIADLSFIRQEDDTIRIGALITHQAMVESSLLRESAPVLVEAAASIGCPQTRNRGTLGGNLANASPAADTIPALFILNALIHLFSRRGFRQVSPAEFLIAPRTTCLRQGEIIHSITFPIPTGRHSGCFLKIGKRNGMSIAVVSAAVGLWLDDSGKIGDVRAAVGSASPTVVRCHRVEQALMGKKPDVELFQQAAQEVQTSISPISDIRATSQYRQHAAVVLLRRAFTTAWERFNGGINR